MEVSTMSLSYASRATTARGARTAASGPGPLTRLAARIRSSTLDRALIAGGDPAASAQLAKRAAHLTAPATRAALASAIEARLRRVNERPSISRVMPRREAVNAHAGALIELAARLRGPEPLYAPGIARVRELMTDGTGPLYRDDAAALGRALAELTAAIGGADAASAATAPRRWAPAC